MTENISNPTPEVTVAEKRDKFVSKRGRRLLGALIALLIILLLAAGFALTQFLFPKNAPREQRAPGITWVRSIYGYGTTAAEMVEPASVAVDPSGDGTLWIGDQGRFRIVKFDPNGRMLEIVTGDPASGDSFDFPSRITVAPDGWLYVAQGTYNNVKVYDDGGTLRQVIPVPNPSSIDVNDEMVVVGSVEGFVAFDREGNYIGEIGGVRGKEDGQFDVINGVVLDDESNAYIIDTYNNRISKYDREGERLWIVETGPPANQAGDTMTAQTGLEEKYPAMMQAPMGACLDAAGRLIVIDLLDFSVAAFDSETGEFIEKWGDFGREDGLFAYPADIDYDPAHDWFIVADSGNQRAQIIRLPGSGGGALEAARRFLSGPIKACLIPLLLLIVLFIVWTVLRKRSEKKRAQQVLPVSPVDSSSVGTE